ncbi:hypothetical protein, partial [Streptococcus pseudopneumoniae]|uniref:hypothetical protein n=1 Tax=Streptococcus pseudopneumoniae TaxID=257758 RepID=UPI0019D622C4
LIALPTSVLVSVSVNVRIAAASMIVDRPDPEPRPIRPADGIRRLYGVVIPGICVSQLSSGSTIRVSVQTNINYSFWLSRRN